MEGEHPHDIIDQINSGEIDIPEVSSPHNHVFAARLTVSVLAPWYPCKCIEIMLPVCYRFLKYPVSTLTILMNDRLCGVITNSAGEINSKPSVKPVRWIHACLSVPDDGDIHPFVPTASVLLVCQ